ncbi:MAG: PmeII family type II restriction endonuclease [Phototrophicales bacterium]
MIDPQQLIDFVNEQISIFHQDRVRRLEQINLKTILKRKNPYLFKAKGIETAEQLIRSMLDAQLSSLEEKLFGDFLERLAIYVCGLVYNGQKSSAKGIDLEFEKDHTWHVVSIKSGPNWGNSSQYRALEHDFRNALKIQRQSRRYIQAVLGICYGNTKTTDNGLYTKITGQNFWHFISGDPQLYIKIIEPIGHEVEAHYMTFMEERTNLEQRLASRFIDDFCFPDGRINWEKLVSYNSGNLSNA